MPPWWSRWSRLVVFVGRVTPAARSGCRSRPNDLPARSVVAGRPLTDRRTAAALGTPTGPRGPVGRSGDCRITGGSGPPGASIGNWGAKRNCVSLCPSAPDPRPIRRNGDVGRSANLSGIVSDVCRPVVGLGRARPARRTSAASAAMGVGPFGLRYTQRCKTKMLRRQQLWLALRS